MANRKLTDILKSAILLEVRGEAFYRKVAADTENAGIKKIFAIMADEEVIHADILREKFKEVVKTNKLSESGIPVNTEDVNAAGFVLSESMKNQIAGAGFEAAAISAAIDMETKAITLYSESAENAADENEKRLFSWLADWERGHHKLLYELDRDLKERIWNDNNFWPF
ncbi:MAG: ferritin family protein [Bacteroidales bacterium]